MQNLKHSDFRFQKTRSGFVMFQNLYNIRPSVEVEDSLYLSNQYY